MRDIHTLEELLNTRTPIVAVESHEEGKVLGLLEKLCNLNGRRLFIWNIAQGLRLSTNTDSIYGTQELAAALRHIQASPVNALYVLIDAHPFFDDPMVVRLAKNIALKADVVPRVLVFLSPEMELPDELNRYAARFSPGMTDREAILRLLREEVHAWLGSEGGRLRGERAALDALVQHLIGLTEGEARRLIRLAIRDDGLLTQSDIEKVLKAKHEFLGVGDVLALETSVASMGDVGGLAGLKRWLELRHRVFMEGDPSGAAAAEGNPAAWRAGRRQEPRRQGGGRRLEAAAFSHGFRCPLQQVPWRDRTQPARSAENGGGDVALRAVDG